VHCRLRQSLCCGDIVAESDLGLLRYLRDLLTNEPEENGASADPTYGEGAAVGPDSEWYDIYIRYRFSVVDVGMIANPAACWYIC
jgi:hypothetical protein